MEMSEDYRDHDIQVWTTEAATGRFSWSHTIDGKHLATNEDSLLPSEEIALQEGTKAARWRIDAWLKAEGKT